MYFHILYSFKGYLILMTLGFVDTALKILIFVVVGALLLAGLYALSKDTILLTRTQKIANLLTIKDR